jgi:hypothetical protein
MQTSMNRVNLLGAGENNFMTKKGNRGPYMNKTIPVRLLIPYFSNPESSWFSRGATVSPAELYTDDSMVCFARSTR